MRFFRFCFWEQRKLKSHRSEEGKWDIWVRKNAGQDAFPRKEMGRKKVFEPGNRTVPKFRNIYDSASPYPLHQWFDFLSYFPGAWVALTLISDQDMRTQWEINRKFFWVKCNVIHFFHFFFLKKPSNFIPWPGSLFTSPSALLHPHSNSMVKSLQLDTVKDIYAFF